MRLALLVEHDVGRLDVAMDDPLAVGVADASAKLPHELGSLPEVLCVLFVDVRQRPAGDKGRGNVVLITILALASWIGTMCGCRSGGSG